MPAQGLDKSALFGHLDEHRGRHHAQARVFPAAQRLGAHRAAVGEAVDGLVVQAQFAALPGAAQFFFQLHPALHRLVHGLGIKAVAALAGDLGLVHGDVGVLEQLHGAGRIEGEQRDAHRGAQEHLPPLQHQRPLHFFDQLLGQTARAGADVFGQEQHDEFVATEAGDLGALPAQSFDRHADAHRQLAQHFVAGLVAQGVVDALEVVQVHEQQGQFAAAGLQGHQAVVERFAESQSVGQAGQRIGVGHAADVAVVPRHGFGHAPEATHQVAQFVLALRAQFDLAVAALFHAPGRVGQFADGLHDTLLQQPHRQYRDAELRGQQRHYPCQVFAIGLAQAGFQRAQHLDLSAQGVVARKADAHAADAFAADADRAGDVEQLVVPLAVRALGLQRLEGHRVGHRLAEGRDVAGAVVQHLAFGVVDDHVHHVGLAQRGARQFTQLGQVQVVHRVGGGVGQLARQRVAAHQQALAGQFAHGVGAQFAGVGIAALGVQPKRSEQRGDHQHHQGQQPGQFTAQAQPERQPHSRASRTRRAPRWSSSSERRVSASAS